METTAIEGASRLIDYGLLGIFLLLALVAIVVGFKYIKEIVTIFIKDKDEQIERGNKSIQKRDDQLDGVLVQLSANSTRLIDLYEHQQRSIDNVPDRTVEKLQIALNKKLN